MSSRRIQTTISREKLIMLGSFTFLFALFVAYMYFVCASVVHVVIRKEITTQISSLHSEIGKLEAEYIKQQHAVSNEVATQHGFVAVRDKIFLDRSDTSLVLSDNR